MGNTDIYMNTHEVAFGNVYVMSHSFFSDVIKIGCTPLAPIEHAFNLSQKNPGDYRVVFSLQCKNPCQIKNKFENI